MRETAIRMMLTTPAFAEATVVFAIKLQRTPNYAHLWSPASLQFTVRVPVLVPPLAVPLIFTVVFALTTFVVTGKVPKEEPAGTVILGSKDATAVAPLATVNVTTVF